jgi:hypothetical protein
MPKKIKPSLEFEEKKKLLDIVTKKNKDKHLMKMKEFLFLRESELIHHNHEMERQRIKTVEIRKAQDRKSWQDFHRNNPHG